jgi:hypothetical protein
MQMQLRFDRDEQSIKFHKKIVDREHLFVCPIEVASDCFPGSFLSAQDAENEAKGKADDLVQAAFSAVQRLKLIQADLPARIQIQRSDFR